MAVIIRDYADLVSIINQLKDDIERINGCLDELKLGFFTNNKLEVLKKRQKLKEQLINDKNLLNNYIDFCEKSTTFESLELARFLSTYLTYVFDDRRFCCITNINVFENSQTYPKGYILIVDSNDFDKVRNFLDEKRNRLSNVDTLLDICQGSYICYGGYSKYSLVKGTDLSNYFGDFPELNFVIPKLITLKLQYPDMSDEERLEIVLDEAFDEITQAMVKKNVEKILAKKKQESSSPKRPGFFSAKWKEFVESV